MMKPPRATLQNAYTNIVALLGAAQLPDVPWRRDVEAYEQPGYFAFIVTIDGDEVSVAMPGCTTEALMDTEHARTPRIHIDGHSWFWRFAVDTLRDWRDDRAAALDERRPAIGARA